MFFKKLKQTSTLLLLSLFIFPLNVLAYSDKIYAGGENIGIEIESSKVLIVGSYKIQGEDIALKSGLKAGDMIVAIDNTNIASIDDMIKVISNANKDTVKITYERKNKEYTTDLKIIKENDIFKTGLYVKDTITGIGTLTFVDPATKFFGALGHEVADSTTGIMLEVKNGKIVSSEVTSIDRSDAGTPGAKNATIHSENPLGSIKENTTQGIFGTYTEEYAKEHLYTVAKENDIAKGEASILTVTDDNVINAYKIEILKIDKNAETKNILFEIKDEKLLEETGGIVQGMSGSPIIQGDYIIGAVTHVVVDNPKRGYGIFITKMLEEAED